MWFFSNEDSNTGKYLAILLGTAAIIFGVGYALRPAAQIVDELHDSDETF